MKCPCIKKYAIWYTRTEFSEENIIFQLQLCGLENKVTVTKLHVFNSHLQKSRRTTKQTKWRAPSEDSDQPGHLRAAWVAKNPIFLHADSEGSDQPGHLCAVLVVKDPIFLHADSKAGIRLDGCAGWSESSLCAQVILLVLSCCSLYSFNVVKLCNICCNHKIISSLCIIWTYFWFLFCWFYGPSRLFQSFELSQALGEAKTGDHPQAELGLSHMCVS